jgi:hypothetical protein
VSLSWAYVWESKGWPHTHPTGRAPKRPTRERPRAVKGGRDRAAERGGATAANTKNGDVAVIIQEVDRQKGCAVESILQIGRPPQRETGTLHGSGRHIS